MRYLRVRIVWVRITIASEVFKGQDYHYIRVFKCHEFHCVRGVNQLINSPFFKFSRF